MFSAWLCRWSEILRAFKVLSVCWVVAMCLWRRKIMQICIDKNKSEGSRFFSPFHLHKPVHIPLSTQKKKPFHDFQCGQAMGRSSFSWIFEILTFFSFSLLPLVLLPVSHGYVSVCVAFGFLPWRRMLELILVTFERSLHVPLHSYNAHTSYRWNRLWLKPFRFYK